MPSFKCIKFEKGVYFLLTSADIRMFGQLREFFAFMPIRPGISQNVFVLCPREKITLKDHPQNIMLWHFIDRVFFRYDLF